MAWMRIGERAEWDRVSECHPVLAAIHSHGQMQMKRRNETDSRSACEVRDWDSKDMRARVARLSGKRKCV